MRSTICCSLLIGITLLLAVQVSAFPAFKGGSSSPIKLEGEVKKLTVERNDSSFIAFKIELDLKFVNVSKRKVFLYKQKPWLGAELLAYSLEEAKSHIYFYKASAWPANDISPVYQQLQHQLNQSLIAEELLLSIEPGRSWRFDVTAVIEFEKKGNNWKHEDSWRIIQNKIKLWMRVELEVWPLNLEPANNRESLEFGKQLQHRWRKQGLLVLENIVSEPIPLDLSLFQLAALPLR